MDMYMNNIIKLPAHKSMGQVKVAYSFGAGMLR
jgi:hypothetical protein